MHLLIPSPKAQVFVQLRNTHLTFKQMPSPKLGSTTFARMLVGSSSALCQQQASSIQSSGAREPGWDRPCGWEAVAVLSGWWTRATRLAQSPFRKASAGVRRLMQPRTLPVLITHTEQWGAWIAMSVPPRTQQSFWRLRCIHERPVGGRDLGCLQYLACFGGLLGSQQRL